MSRISQREARSLRKRVAALQAILKKQRDSWSGDWIGTEIARITFTTGDSRVASIRTARRLAHAVVAIDSGDEIRFVALPHPSEPIK